MSNSSFLADIIGDISPDRDYVLDPSRNPAIVLSSALPPLVDNTRLVKLKGARLTEILRAKDHANEAGSEVLVVGSGSSSMRSHYEDWIQLSRERERPPNMLRGSGSGILPKRRPSADSSYYSQGTSPRMCPRTSPRTNPRTARSTTAIRKREIDGYFCRQVAPRRTANKLKSEHDILYYTFFVCISSSLSFYLFCELIFYSRLCAKFRLERYFSSRRNLWHTRLDPD